MLTLFATLAAETWLLLPVDFRTGEMHLQTGSFLEHVHICSALSQLNFQEVSMPTTGTGRSLTNKMKRMQKSWFFLFEISKAGAGSLKESKVCLCGAWAEAKDQ